MSAPLCCQLLCFFSCITFDHASVCLQIRHVVDKVASFVAFCPLSLVDLCHFFGSLLHSGSKAIRRCLPNTISYMRLASNHCGKSLESSRHQTWLFLFESDIPIRQLMLGILHLEDRSSLIITSSTSIFSSSISTALSTIRLDTAIKTSFKK
ncbi:hypothetical protein V8C35DRAFT_88551 [Trichoderma chlorosporum]